MEILVKKNKEVVRVGRGIFIMLAIGTLPTLFSNPTQYIIGLVICAGIAFGLAKIIT